MEQRNKNHSSLMEYIKENFRTLSDKTNRRRLLLSIVGVFVAGFSVGLFKNDGFGTDPFQVLCAGLHTIIPISFGTFYVIFNIVLLVAMYFADKRYIGLATLVNLLLLGYMVQWSTDLWASVFPDPNMTIRILLMLVAIMMLSMAASMYITSDLGVSTYDIWALYFAGHTPIPFKYWRILTDSFCVLLGWILGGTVGAGTLITAFFMGPLIDFFNRKVSQPLLKA